MSLFNRPKWATQAKDEAESTQDIFSHSRSYADVVAEEQRRKKAREQKEKIKQERKERRTSAKREAEEEENMKDSSSPKRRRITLEEGDDLLGSVGLTTGLVKRRSGPEDEDEGEDMSRRRSPRVNKGAPKHDTRFAAASKPAHKASKPEVIELGGTSGSDEEVQFSHAKPAKPVEPVDPESDDEFAELRRQARARNKRQESIKKSQTPVLNSPTPGQEAADESRSAYPTPPAPDPPVKLFITSEIPGTKPLMVVLRLSQRLKELRVVWCDRQGFAKDFAEKVFLTHKMRRVFDVTTCRSLGLSADAEGNITLKGHEGAEGVDQVHLEAVTEDIFREMKAVKEKEERVRHGTQTQEEQDAEAAASEPPPEPEQQVIRILLTAKDRKEPYKLKVKPVCLCTSLSNMLSLTVHRRVRWSPKLSLHARRSSTSRKDRPCTSTSTVNGWSRTRRLRIPRSPTWIASMSISVDVQRM